MSFAWVVALSRGNAVDLIWRDSAIVAGKPNGILRAWLDKNLVFQTSTALFRTSGTHFIEKFAFHNFHGGKVCTSAACQAPLQLVFSVPC
jgi:hypothetical protein